MHWRVTTSRLSLPDTACLLIHDYNLASMHQTTHSCCYHNQHHHRYIIHPFSLKSRTHHPTLIQHSFPLLTPTKQSPNIPPSTFRALRSSSTHCFDIIHSRVRHARRRTAITPTVVFAASFRSIDAFFAHSVAHGLQKSSLSDLAGDSVVDAILDEERDEC